MATADELDFKEGLEDIILSFDNGLLNTEETVSKILSYIDEYNSESEEEPRFYITSDDYETRIRDRKIPTNAGLHLTMAIFYKNDEYDFNVLAQQLCKRLNILKG